MLYCSKCSFIGTPGDTYCGKCGGKLEWQFTGATKPIVLIGLLLAVLVCLESFRETIWVMTEFNLPFSPLSCLAFLSLASIVILFFKKGKLSYLVLVFAYTITMALDYTLFQNDSGGLIFSLYLPEGLVEIIHRIIYLASVSLFFISYFVELRKDSLQAHNISTNTEKIAD